jgi:glucoamylase
MKYILLTFLSIISFNYASLVCPDTSSSNGRNDCGYLGITQNECINKGCCWQPTSDHSAYCTYPIQQHSNNYYTPNLEQSSEPFEDYEVDVFFKYFLNNIDINLSGAIAAAPDTNTPGGSYYYHWARDGALTMDCLQGYTNSSFSYKYSSDYLRWIQLVQSKKDPNGIDVRIEPKYEIPSGDAYTGGWCRPQNDGPGLQAIALINSPLDVSKSWETIKYNLDYIVSGYNSATCDLWEEIQSQDFFWNRVTMAKALSLGSKLAKTLGYNDIANNWLNLANTIKSNIYSTHWNGYYYYESNNRPVDGAVIVALNNGYDESDNFLDPLSYEVASTIYHYNLVFSNEYYINYKDKPFLGILYGRYPGDIYAGGNPWILTTAALASLMYRVSNKVELGYKLSQDTQTMWCKALNVDKLPTDVVSFFKAQGDGLLLRVRIYIEGYDFHMYEQLDKNTGEQISAYDLTWSYAEVLNALRYRELIKN